MVLYLFCYHKLLVLSIFNAMNRARLGSYRKHYHIAVILVQVMVSVSAIGESHISGEER